MTRSRTKSEEDDVVDVNYPRKLQLGLAAVGFIISAFLILCGLLVLCRFWVYSKTPESPNLDMNHNDRKQDEEEQEKKFWEWIEWLLFILFAFSILIIGISFNITSINMVLVQVDSIWSLSPFIFGSGISIMWNVAGIILPFAKPGFFERFSNVPYVFYDEYYYYSKEAYDSVPEPEEHKFLKKFNKHSGIFHHELFVVIVLILLLLAQITFYACLVKLYRRLKSANYLLAKAEDDEAEDLKEL